MREKSSGAETLVLELPVTLEAVTDMLVIDAIKRHRGDRVKAAADLGICAATVYNRLRRPELAAKVAELGYPVTVCGRGKVVTAEARAHMSTAQRAHRDSKQAEAKF